MSNVYSLGKNLSGNSFGGVGRGLSRGRANGIVGGRSRGNGCDTQDVHGGASVRGRGGRSGRGRGRSACGRGDYRDHEFQHFPIANLQHTRFCNSRILQFLFTGTLVVMYIPLISFVQIMFQTEEHSPFKTHAAFMIMSAAGLTIATITFGLVFYMNENLESQMGKQVYLIGYIILKTVFCFCGILAPLSLLLVLFLRDHSHYWIGYSIICTVFVVVVASNVFGYMIKLRGKKEDVACRMV